MARDDFRSVKGCDDDASGRGGGPGPGDDGPDLAEGVGLSELAFDGAQG